MTFRCSVCGEIHDGIPDFGFKYPDHYFGVPESERDSRIRCDSDLCAVDDEHFYVRGVILIPIHDQEHNFGIGAWVSLAKENFETYLKNYDSDQIGPFFGWLSNRIPFYEQDSMNLKTMVHFQGEGQRPLIMLEDINEHPLCIAAHSGLTAHAVWELVRGLEDGE